MSILMILIFAIRENGLIKIFYEQFTDFCYFDYEMNSSLVTVYDMNI